MNKPATSLERLLAELRRVHLPAYVLVGLVGVLGGIGAFTFGYGEGSSYLSDDPAACAGCHVMHQHFDSWQASSHHHVAVCNDCHAPTGLGKWWTKADNGFFHSLAFTTGRYPDPIQIKQRNADVTQEACLRCHATTVYQMLPEPGGEIPRCVHCHAQVGHAFRARRGAKTNR